MRPRKEGGVWKYPHSADVLQAAGLRTIADCIALRRANIARTIRDRKVLKECREAQRRRGSPLREMWWDQELNFVKEGTVGGGGLGFVMQRRNQDDRSFGRRNTMEDHHSRLRRQMAEEMGREPEAPLLPPPGRAVPWHHRSGPLGGGLGVMPEGPTTIRGAMQRISLDISSRRQSSPNEGGSLEGRAASAAGG